LLRVAKFRGQAEDDRRLVTSWAEDLTGRLRSVQCKVAAIESALGTENLRTGAEAAHELVVLTTGLLEDIELRATDDSEAEAKLIATLRVYRNAAFAYRKLAGVSGESDPAMASVCLAMIEHGHELRALFDQDPDQGHLHP
jgi:hypothetical protein